MRRFVLLAVCLSLSGQSLAAEYVAKRMLRAGTILMESDLRVVGTVNQDEIAKMQGQELRRTVYEGRAVVPSDLGPPTLVRRNDVLAIKYSSGGLSLRTEGRALGSGGLGEIIDVMNLDTRITVRAVVVGVNEVVVRQ